jgi:hypothetical protein
LYREAGITEEFGVVSHFKRLSNIRGTHQRLTCVVASREIASFKLFFVSGSNHDEPFAPEHIRTLHSATNTLWLQQEEAPPIFWKYYPSVIKRKV